MKLINSKYRDVIEDIPAIEFVSLVEQPGWIVNASIHEQSIRLGLIDRTKTTEVQQIDWIKNILQEQNVSGEFLMSFGDLTLAKVIFRGISWVSDIWRIGEYIFLVPIDQTCFISVGWSEACTGNDCIVILKTVNPQST